MNVDQADTDAGWRIVGDVATFAAAWVAALGELEDVTRGRTADAGSYAYRYASLDAVLGAARSVLAAHDLALFQIPNVELGAVAISTVVMHSSGAHLEAPVFRLPSANGAQAVGSAISYGRRYSAMAVLGIAATEDDDDGATAGTSPVSGGGNDPTSETARPDPVVVETFAALSGLSPDAQAELRRLADEHGRKLSQAALAADPTWLAVVRDVVDRDHATERPANATGVLASRAQLAALDAAERRAELGMARTAVVRAVIGRDVDDPARLSRHEAADLIAAYDDLEHDLAVLIWQPDGTVVLTARTDTTDPLPEPDPA